MKRLLFVVLAFSSALYACNSTTQADKEVAASKKFVDSIRQQLMVDSIANVLDRQSTDNLLFDTSNLATSPVRVLKAHMVQEEYSSFRNIELVYKNISKKPIAAIKFRWYGEDAFGDPADMGNYQFEGFGGGMDDGGLSAGHVSSGTWDILSQDGKKVVKAWPVEVQFKDGTKWEAK